MRPVTLSEAVARIENGAPAEIAFGEFLDHFYTASDSARIRGLDDEPALQESAEFNALVAAIAEHLTKSYTAAPAPSWVNKQSRFLARPWFPARDPDDALREYLTWVSPAAFKRRNIMTDASPLRRAATPKPNEHKVQAPRSPKTPVP